MSYPTSSINNGRHTGVSLRTAKDAIQKVRFPADILLFLYVLAVLREYLWWLGETPTNNLVAWTLASIAAGAIIWPLIGRRDPGRPGVGLLPGLRTKRPDWQWLAIVCAPLLAFFCLRLPFPAFEFDHLNYHLVNIERALRGWPLRPGDFFPGTLLVNPAPDMVFGVAKYLVGYRAAPIINILALIWTGQIANTFLQPSIERKGLRYFAILFILCTEEVLYLVNIYMVDLLALPLMLEATLDATRFREIQQKNVALLRIGLFFGLSLAFKITNVCFIMPIAGLLLYQLYLDWRTRSYLPVKKTIIIFCSAVILPSAVFWVYMCALTGNPVFPYYNAIFHSPLMKAVNYRDQIHGPSSPVMALAWPLISTFLPERLCAMCVAFMYTGRINLGFLISIFVLFSKKLNRELRFLSFITVTGTFLWSFATGDIRYGLVEEIYGGTVICATLSSISQLLPAAAAQLKTKRDVLRVATAKILFTTLLGIQMAFALWFALIHFDCFAQDLHCDRDMQPTIMNRFVEPTFRHLYHLPMPMHLELRSPREYFREARFLFQDRSPEKFFSDEQRNAFRDVEIWINCIDATSGYMTIARPDVPMISMAKFLYLFDYMEAPEARRRVRAMLQQNSGYNMYTLTYVEDLGEVKERLSKIAPEMQFTETRRVSVPMYSPYMYTNLLLLKIEPREKTAPEPIVQNQQPSTDQQ